MELLTDLSRLMVDDGDTRQARLCLPDDTVATFVWRGKRWAAYRITERYVERRCWHMSRRGAQSTDLPAFLADPVAFIDQYMLPDDTEPGFEQNTGAIFSEDYWVLCFKELV